MLKLFRRLEPGINPDIEVGRRADRGGLPVHARRRWLARLPDAAATSRRRWGCSRQFVPNEGDVWEYTLDQIGDFYERAAAAETRAPDAIRLVAVRRSLAARHEPPPDARDRAHRLVPRRGAAARRAHRRSCTRRSRRWTTRRSRPSRSRRSTSARSSRRCATSRRATFATLRQRQSALADGRAGAGRRALSRSPTRRWPRCATLDLGQAGRACASGPTATTTLGQVLWTGKDVVIIDFEGEPGRPLSERRFKRSALTDVAGMLRSFHYAAYGTLLNPRLGGSVAAGGRRRVSSAWASFWYRERRGRLPAAPTSSEARGQAFVPDRRGRARAPARAGDAPEGALRAQLRAQQSPDWVSIPLRGLLDLFGLHERDRRHSRCRRRTSNRNDGPRQRR